MLEGGLVGMSEGLESMGNILWCVTDCCAGEYSLFDGFNSYYS